jgi:hypothetical protein
MTTLNLNDRPRPKKRDMSELESESQMCRERVHHVQRLPANCAKDLNVLRWQVCIQSLAYMLL